MALQSSQRLPELLFYTKKSYRILQLQFYKGTHPSYTTHPSTYNLHVHITLQYIQRILHPESNSTCRRQRALRVLLLLHTEGKETFIPERNSTHRRQGDLLEIHPCVLQDIPGIQPQDLPKASGYCRHSSLSRHSRHSSLSSLSSHSRHSKDIPDIPVTHDLPTFPGNSTILQVPVSPGIPPHSSILQLECIFYIFYVFYNFYSSIGFHRKLHRVPVKQLQTTNILQTFILQRKGDVVISVKRASVKMSR